MTYPITLNFIKVFKEPVGIQCYKDSIGFVSVAMALSWVKNVNNNRHCDYQVVCTSLHDNKPRNGKWQVAVVLLANSDTWVQMNIDPYCIEEYVCDRRYRLEQWTYIAEDGVDTLVRKEKIK